MSSSCERGVSQHLPIIAILDACRGRGSVAGPTRTAAAMLPSWEKLLTILELSHGGPAMFSLALQYVCEI